MFYSDLEHGLRLLPRITTDHINLTSYSVMRVNLAAQVLSSSMASVLKSFGSPDAFATVEFCEKMNRFFDCLNVRNTTTGERTGKASMLPYKDVNDEKLTKDDFLKYLSAWNESVTQRPGTFDENARARMFISRQMT